MPAPSPLPRTALRVAAGGLILAALGTLVGSYFLPTVTFQRILKAPETFSIFGGIESLWTFGSPVLAVVVFAFSFVFPLFKILVLGVLWCGRPVGEARRRVLQRLRLLGKWSMLDVFVIAAFVGAIRLGALAEGRARIGILIFGLGVLLSMAATFLVHLCEPPEHATPPEPPAPADGVRRSGPARLLTVLGAVGLVGAYAYPIFRVSVDGLLRPITNDLLLTDTTRRMFRGDDWMLACAVLGFVLVAPALRTLLLLRLRFLGGEGALAQRGVHLLDEWAMLDVYALGIMVVESKLSELAECDLHRGFWIAIAAALLTEWDAWNLRRARRAVRLGGRAASGPGRVRGTSGSRPGQAR